MWERLLQIPVDSKRVRKKTCTRRRDLLETHIVLSIIENIEKDTYCWLRVRHPETCHMLEIVETCRIFEIIETCYMLEIVIAFVQTFFHMKYYLNNVFDI